MPPRTPPSLPAEPRPVRDAGAPLRCALRLVLPLALAVPAAAATPDRDDATATARERPVPSSFVEIRDRGVVRQRRDYSCGAAALATLLAHQWGDPVGEEDILATLSRVVSAEELERRRADGLTLLDLSRTARARGYRAQGFRLAAEQLGTLSGPVIVFIDPDGFEHFSVLRGIVGDRAHLADPAHGNVSYPLHRFLDMWLDGDGLGVVLATAPLRSNADSLPAGALAPPVTRATDTALEHVRSRLPFSTLDVPTRPPTR